MNDIKENQENSNSNDTNEVEETTENNAGEEAEGDSGDTDLKSAIAQKKRYREKFEKSDEVMTKLFGDDWEDRVDEIDLDEKPKQQKSSSSEEKDLSQKDLISIIKNDVHEEDIEEVKDFADLKNISVTEALDSITLKTILSEKKENRQTAQATHTGKTKSKGAKVSDSELLRKADKGEFPEPGTSEAKRLYELRRESK
jgi:hypothetical protein